MKHKAVIIPAVCLAALSLVVVGVFLFNPALATRFISSVSVQQTPTEAPTQAATQAPTVPTVQQLQAEETKDTLKRGDTLVLTPGVIPNTAKHKELTFTSSNENVASVDSTGKVTALSAGDCTITAAAAANKKATAVYKFKVTDARIDEIKILNDYLLALPTSQKISYGDKKSETAKLAKCKITDYDNNGHYELFIQYQIGASVTAVEIVTLRDNKPVSLKTYDSFTSLLDKKATSYNEIICTNETGYFYIKSTAIKTDSVQNKRTVTLYSTSGASLSRVKTMSDVYRYKNGGSVPTDGTFMIDGQQATEETYLSDLASLSGKYQEFTDWVDRTLRIAQGKYEKAQLAVELEEVYKDRIEWTTSDKAVATVNKTGVVTGKNIGNCEIRGTLSCLSGAISYLSVTVQDNSDILAKYLDSVKDTVIKAENGTALALYASKAIDVDGDGVNELALYYTGGRSCQIDIAKEDGSNIKRSTAFFASTDSTKTCRLDIYMDNTTGGVVLCENYLSSSGLSKIVEFTFNAYTDGRYKTGPHTYKIVTDTANKDNTTYYIDGEKTKKDAFHNAVSHYGKFAQWDIDA